MKNLLQKFVLLKKIKKKLYKISVSKNIKLCKLSLFYLESLRKSFLNKIEENILFNYEKNSFQVNSTNKIQICEYMDLKSDYLFLKVFFPFVFNIKNIFEKDFKIFRGYELSSVYQHLVINTNLYYFITSSLKLILPISYYKMNRYLVCHFICDYFSMVLEKCSISRESRLVRKCLFKYYTA